jgi:plasmid replication initiation protein
MKNKNLIVCKSNNVIEAGYRLSLNEQRVILACISKVNSMNELLESDEFELSAQDFALMYNISQNRAYGELKEVSKNLYHRSLTIFNPDPNRPKIEKIETRWISSIAYLPDDGKVILRFSKDILPFLGELKGQFTRYKLEHIGKMTSIYAIRLYELLAQWKNIGKREVELNWLKQQLQLDSSYERMNNLKARVIEPAVKDINTHSNFYVTWTQRKTGKKISHLVFEFKEKKNSLFVKPKNKVREDVANVSTTNNIDYFADMRKKFGDLLPENAIPEDMIKYLKSQNRW